MRWKNTPWITLGLASTLWAGQVSAQTADFMVSVAQFVGGASIAGPSCGHRDRAWALRLTARFVSTVNDLPPEVVTRLPEGHQGYVLDWLSQSQRDARDAIAANRAGYCASTMTAERLGHLDSLAEGTMPFW